MKHVVVALMLFASLSCTDSTAPNVLGSLSFDFTGGGGGTFDVQGNITSLPAPTTISWAAGYTESGETFVGGSKPRSGQQVDATILRINRTTEGSEPIDPVCDEDGDVACTTLVLLLNFNGNGDTADFFCGLTAGTITITAINETRAKGTFSGSGNCVAGAGGATTAFAVTNGEYDVFLVPSPTTGS